MLERFLVQFLAAVVERLAERRTAVDADSDRSRLRLAAWSLRRWLHENGARPKG